MCVLALMWRAHPRWRLILAGNRDEYHDRPAAPLARWADREVIAGRDLQSGGTWLGVSERGALAVFTNLRGYGGPEPDRPSRGALVTDMLTGEGAFADPDEAMLARFNPVNLIVVDHARAQFISNRPGVMRSALAPGVYGLSNGTLDEPWPKTMRLKSVLQQWIMGAADMPHRLFDGLREEVLPPVGLDPAAPSDVPQEPRHSPIFIRDPVYGTRCSTVVAIDERGQGWVAERRFNADGAAVGETELTFSWPG